MLRPHPAVLRALVEEYETLTATATPEARARAQDLAYTLCVSTGTRDVGSALETARGWLVAAEAAGVAEGAARRLVGRAPGVRTRSGAADLVGDLAGSPHPDEGPHVYA
ncbi:DUF5133 domain-containing protein [Streptomyces sp. NPDC000345]|uniref:DUF5133 domain-containing protein n=1 Tax=Streptomyces sp. NPDC000345 TaxID=3364537 RepID=UPI0036ABBCF8